MDREINQPEFPTFDPSRNIYIATRSFRKTPGRSKEWIRRNFPISPSPRKKTSVSNRCHYITKHLRPEFKETPNSRLGKRKMDCLETHSKKRKSSYGSVNVESINLLNTCTRKLEAFRVYQDQDLFKIKSKETAEKYDQDNDCQSDDETIEIGRRLMLSSLFDAIIKK